MTTTRWLRRPALLLGCLPLSAALIAACESDANSPPDGSTTGGGGAHDGGADPGGGGAGAEAGGGGSGGEGLVTYTEDRVPCADRNALRNAYYGDLHLHTSLSLDAFSAGTVAGPAEAFAFARGDAAIVIPASGASVTIDRPLDFGAVTDHAEYIGEVWLCTTPGSATYDGPLCNSFRSGGAAFVAWMAQLATQSPSRPAFCTGAADDPCPAALASAWAATQQAVEDHYDRTDTCVFTPFVAYEYTATPGTSMLHRNVIFRNDEVPSVPTSFVEANTADDLWTALDTDCNHAGGRCEVLAIPHNANLSNGNLFPPEAPGNSVSEQAAYAARRSRIEPLMEMYQHKGASECFPGFSSDENCSFEVIAQAPCTNGDVNCASPMNFFRGVVGAGLAEQQRIGENPYRLGVVGATDSHNATLGAVAEDAWRGHVGNADASALGRLTTTNPEFSPGAVTGVWAVENSRDALFEAMKRRETFATSGPRIAVRFFGGTGIEENACAQPNMLEQAYANGMPMGATLPASTGAPRFLVSALADVTPLQQLQIVKIWVDSNGGQQEAVFPIGGDPDNGAGVDPATCSLTGNGFDALCATWTDPNFDASQHAAYYARVLENPTCRWSTRDCNSLGSDAPAVCDDLPKTIQERAWTSPIWYTP